MSVETVISKNFGETKTPTTWEIRLNKDIGENNFGFIQFDSEKRAYVGLGWKF